MYLYEPMTGVEPVTSSLPRKCSTTELHRQIRAEDGVQTRDPQLGRLMLYQLSYFRKISPHLSQPLRASPSQFRASCRIRTNDPEITNPVLWPTELKRQMQFCKLFQRPTSEIACKYRHYFLIRKNFCAFLTSCFLFSLFYLDNHSVHRISESLFERVRHLCNNKFVVRHSHFHKHLFIF